MRWLMTVQEQGSPGLKIADWPFGVEFDLEPRRISFNRAIGDGPQPNPNCLTSLQHWPKIVEIRRPDGTQISAEPIRGSRHINFPYKLRGERDAAGRIRSPWQQTILLKDVDVEDVPPGSELWGEFSDEDLASMQESENTSARAIPSNGDEHEPDLR